MDYPAVLTKTHLTTEELAELLGVKPSTLRRGLCVNGHYLKIKPVKLSNGRLLWPTDRPRKLLGLGAK
jgi:predicted site-specific integrase-resolvase